MPIGVGILLSTIVIVVFASIVFISRYRVWKTVGKVFSVLIGIGLLIALSVWIYFQYTERAIIITNINGIYLGMPEVEVTLAKGKPGTASILESILNGFKRPMLYGSTTIGVEGPSEDKLAVKYVCQYEYDIHIMGFKKHTTEQEIIKKLGNSNNMSINKDGTRKILNYPEYNVSFTLEKNTVISACMTGYPFTFIEEFSK